MKFTSRFVYWTKFQRRFCFQNKPSLAQVCSCNQSNIEAWSLLQRSCAFEELQNRCASFLTKIISVLHPWGNFWGLLSLVWHVDLIFYSSIKLQPTRKDQLAMEIKTFDFLNFKDGNSRSLRLSSSFAFCIKKYYFSDSLGSVSRV